MSLSDLRRERGEALISSLTQPCDNFFVFLSWFWENEIDPFLNAVTCYSETLILSQNW